jgi:hypothetical protein
MRRIKERKMERTNIVPTTQPENTEGFPEGEVNESRDQTVYSKTLAEDAIQFFEAEFKDDLTEDFWKSMLGICQEKLRVPVEAVTPPEPIQVMTEEESAKFEKENLPWGKYLGQRVGTILRKDRKALENMASKPLPFQVKLRKYLPTRPA